MGKYYKRKGGWGGPRPHSGRKPSAELHVAPDGRVVLPQQYMPQHLVAEIKTLASGPSPADMLLSIARYHMGEAAAEQARAKAAAGQPNAMPLDRTLVRMELTLARVAARDAAAFCHRKLAAVAHTDAEGNNLDIAALAALLNKLPQADQDQLDRILTFIAAATGTTDPAAASDPARKAPTVN